MNCPHCGADVHSEERFCRACGANLRSEPDPASVVEERRVCPWCETYNAPEAEVCMVCGHAFADGAPDSDPDGRDTDGRDTGGEERRRISPKVKVFLAVAAGLLALLLLTVILLNAGTTTETPVLEAPSDSAAASTATPRPTATPTATPTAAPDPFATNESAIRFLLGSWKGPGGANFHMQEYANGTVASWSILGIPEGSCYFDNGWLRVLRYVDGKEVYIERARFTYIDEDTIQVSVLSPEQELVFQRSP